MIVHAIDISGSMETEIPKLLNHLRKNSNPSDLVVAFNDRISKAYRVSDIDSLNLDCVGPAFIEKLAEWMETRHLRPEDKLIIYTDGYINWPRIIDPFYTIEFVVTMANEREIKQIRELTSFKITKI